MKEEVYNSILNLHAFLLLTTSQLHCNTKWQNSCVQHIHIYELFVRCCKLIAIFTLCLNRYDLSNAHTLQQCQWRSHLLYERGSAAQGPAKQQEIWGQKYNESTRKSYFQHNATSNKNRSEGEGGSKNQDVCTCVCVCSFKCTLCNKGRNPPSHTRNLTITRRQHIP
jgi:hypothetical protein